MSSPRRRRRATTDGRRFVKAELAVRTDDTRVLFKVDEFGFSVAIEQADVAQAVFFEDSEKLQIALRQGSIVTLSCTLDDAKRFAVYLLPEERDCDFLFQTTYGDRYCAWDDIR